MHCGTKDTLAKLPRIDENVLHRASDLEALVGMATLRKSNLMDIDWVGELRPDTWPIQPDWARGIRD